MLKYSFLIIVLFIAICESSRKVNRRPWAGNGGSSCNSGQETYNAVTNLFTQIEQDLWTVCSNFTAIVAKDTEAVDAYYFEAYLPEFNTLGALDVRLKHRTMLVLGHIPMPHPTCDKLYISLTILPEYLEYSSATWCYRHGSLEVRIPYRYNSEKEHELGCYDNIDINLKVVPRTC